MRLSILAVLLTFGFFYSANLSAQTSGIDTLAIQKKSRRVAKRYRKTPEALSKKLCENYTDESSKVIAMTYWISKNIKYSYRRYLHGAYYAINSKEVLRKKKAICGEYCALFNDMCAAQGIATATVEGYTIPWDFFDGDTLYRAEHAWTVVKVDGQDFLMDITFGSGVVVPRWQPIAKLGWQLFKIDYTEKFKFKQLYNPDWFYVPPAEMCYSHFPSLSEFQLLKNPIPKKTYENGADSIQQWFQELEPEPIAAYKLNPLYEIEDIARWKYNLNHGEKDNVNNHRFFGYNNYLIANKIFEANYNPNDKTFYGDSLETLEDSRCAFLGDSLITLSKLDNKQEYNAINLRSTNWKKTVIKNNNQLKTAARKRRSHNKRQIAQIKKIKKKQQLLAKKAEDYQKRLAKTLRKKVERTENPSEEKTKRAYEYLRLADSLSSAGSKPLAETTTLLAKNTPQLLDAVVASEKNIGDTYEASLEAIRGYIGYRILFRPKLYHGDNNLLKKWLSEPFYGAMDLNVKSTQAYLDSLENTLNAGKKTLKSYYSFSKNSAKHLQKAKRNSAVDLGEMEQMIALKESYKKDTEAILELNDDCFYAPNKLKRQLRDERKDLSKINSKLNSDSRLERVRNNSYRNYRKRILRRENKRADLILKRLREIQSRIEKSQTPQEVDELTQE